MSNYTSIGYVGRPLYSNVLGQDRKMGGQVEEVDGLYRAER